jgi:ferredoxin
LKITNIILTAYKEECHMEVFVDPDLCISCGTCIDICPGVYDWDDSGKAHNQIEEVPPNLEDCAREGLESCPVDAIREV